ncbi:terpene synthase family protein [Streptomyces jumonjinensis]|uniref:terpene synthase family protein n=1 Tax=Streptomyces jumonjinensis TaxID=1945 RepID=UPI003799E406
MTSSPPPLPAYPWACDAHPETLSLDGWVARWAGEHLEHLPDGTRDLYATMGLGRSVGVVLPYGSPERIRPMVLAFLYGTVLAGSCRDADPRETVRAADRAQELLLGAPPRPGDDGTLRLVALAGRELRTLMPREFVTRYADGLRDFLVHGTARESPYRRAGAVPPVAECLAIRAYSIGTHFALDLIEPVLERPLPPAVAGHPVLARMRSRIIRMTALQNEIATVDRERPRGRHGDVMNVLLAAEDHWGLSAEQSHRYAVHLIQQAVEEFAFLRGALPDFGPDQDLVAESVERIACVPGGWRRWYTETPLPSGTHPGDARLPTPPAAV